MSSLAEDTNTFNQLNVIPEIDIRETSNNEKHL